MINKKIEQYVGRKVDFINEVNLIDYGDGVILIDKWDIPDIPEPTIEELSLIEIDSTLDDLKTELNRSKELMNNLLYWNQIDVFGDEVSSIICDLENQIKELES